MKMSEYEVRTCLNQLTGTSKGHGLECHVVILPLHGYIIFHSYYHVYFIIDAIGP